MSSSYAQIHTCVDQTMVTSSDSSSQSGVYLQSYKWETGSTINVKFIGGEASVRSSIQTVVLEWEKYANVHFNFVNSGPSDIRISFDPNKGAYSKIGTMALYVPQTSETMNLGWFNSSTPYEEIRRTTLHEFGHALGLLHEHQSPISPIQWNVGKVYAHYMQQLGWSKEQIDLNVLNRYQVEHTNYNKFDAASIMIYPVSAEFTLNNFSVGWNTDLSENDKTLIGELYPFNKVNYISTETNITNPSAFIKNTYIEYDVFQNGKKGLIARCDFTIDNFKNKSGRMVASIYNDQNINILSNDFNFSPPFEPSSYIGSSIFIAYEDLNLIYGEYKFSIALRIFDEENTEIANSGKYVFTYHEGPICENLQNMTLKLRTEGDKLFFIPEFYINYAKSLTSKVVVTIYDQGGKKILANTNSIYKNNIGQLATWWQITPCCNTTGYNTPYVDEYAVTIPLEEFNLSYGDNYFNAEVSIESLDGKIYASCKSWMLPFTLTKNP